MIYFKVNGKYTQHRGYVRCMRSIAIDKDKTPTIEIYRSICHCESKYE